MNPELRRLLDRAGYEGAHAPDLWARAVMVHLRGRGLHPEPCMPSHGFHLLLLSPGGSIQYHVKCRHADDAGFARECRVLAALRGDGEFEEWVPDSRSAASSRVRILVSQHLAGPSYGELIGEQSAERWTATMTEVLSQVRRLTERATQIVPWLQCADTEVSLSEELEGAFQRLKDQGMELDTLSRLESALMDIVVPHSLQHGDLWPGNLIRKRDRDWYVIDFERFGEVCFPLYDAFHLLWTSPQVGQSRGEGVWRPTTEVTARPAWTRARCRLLRELADHHGLVPRQVGALMVASLVEWTSHRMRQGMPAFYSDRLRADLREIVTLIGAGVGLGQLADRLLRCWPGT